MTSAAEILRQLGSGRSIANVCSEQGWSREQFDAWFQAECRRRVPPATGSQKVAGCRANLRIVRDARGVPHVLAGNEHDAYFGFGFAVAQDRLFQLDYTRRRAHGRLAEILGPEAVESDTLFRTLDLSEIARREWESMPPDVRPFISAYSDGINACIAASQSALPIEFSLLDYQPEPWSPIDCLAIVGDFRWYLTGRFPVIVVPELVKRAVGTGPRYAAFLGAELDDECILPAGSYSPRSNASSPRPSTAADSSADGGAPAPGSNNWVVAGSRTLTGKPLVASDPHVPFAAVSLWHEAHVRGGQVNFAGVALAGMPAVMIGRNERVAWGVTNNISSLRDLYLERTDDAHPGCFLYDGQWEPCRAREVTIAVRGTDTVRHTVRSTRHGPIVEHLLPAAARHTGPVSLRWQGFQPCGWATATMRSNWARNSTDFRAALEPWSVPTFNVVFADIDGQIGYQCTGHLPRRDLRERAYRPGWEPAHEWNGNLSFDELPRLADPPQQFVVTANNRVAPDDFPHPLSGTWITGYRARRLREAIATQPRMSRDEHRDLQLDIRSGRAAICVPRLLELLSGESDPRVAAALERLGTWESLANYFVTPDSVPAAIFNLFFGHWCRAITAARLPADQVELVSANAGPLAVDLLLDDPHDWLAGRDRRTLARQALIAALDELTTRLGADPNQWQWGRLHTLLQKHFLSGRGDLGQLLDRSGPPIGGDAHTVNSSSPDANHAAWLGAGYRMVVELSDPQAGLWSVDVGSASGHPSSPHYDDQLPTWLAGELLYLALRGDYVGDELTLNRDS